MQKTKFSLILTAALSGAAFAASAELATITVTTPTKSPQSLSTVTSNVDLITAEDIRERGYNTLGELLRTRSALQMVRNGGIGQTTSLFLRGMDSRESLVLVDGVRYNDPTSLAGAQYEHLLLDNVARIEVVKGPQSGIWGADASAGVINIITKRATKMGASATVGAEFGSYNTQKYSLNGGYKTEKYDLSLDLERLSSDGFSAKVPEGRDAKDFEDDGYTNNTANLRAGVDITDSDRIETFLSYIDADTDYDGYDADPVKAANDGASSVKSKEQFYGLSYTHGIDKDSYRLYANRSVFARDYSKGFVKAYNGSTDEAGLESVVHYGFRKGVLSAGLDYKRFRHKNAIDEDYGNTGIYLTNTNTFDGAIGGKTIFTQSLRYDSFTDFDNRLTYKAGVKHYHENIDGFWTSFNYATAYNVPSLYQLYGPYGNRDLNPEKTRGVDLTANYKGFGVTYFNTAVEDLIEYRTTDFTTFAGSYFNVDGKSKLQGVEVAYENMLEALDLAYNFNYTWLDTEDREGKPLPRRAKNTANLALDYYGIPKSHIGAVVRYVGKRTKSQYDANPAEKYPDYTLVDLTADYRVGSALSLYARVENALDKDYQNVTGYATAGRSFYAGLRYRLR